MAGDVSVPAVVASAGRAPADVPCPGDVVLSREDGARSRRYVLFQYPDSPQMICPSRVRALQLATEFVTQHGGHVWERVAGAYRPLDALNGVAARGAVVGAPTGSGLGEVLVRAYSEFVEMPGLRLTVPQAGRLLGAGQASCVRALDVLVEAGFLRRTGGVYGRTADGPGPQMAPGMARASLESGAGRLDGKAS